MKLRTLAILAPFLTTCSLSTVGWAFALLVVGCSRGVVKTEIDECTAGTHQCMADVLCTNRSDGYACDKLRAAYTYADHTGEAEIDELISHGVNTLIIKGGYENNTDYTGGADSLPQTVHTYAALARQKKIMFFQGLNFVHYHFATGTSPSIVTSNYTVYADGTSSGHVSPWDPLYWEHLTALVVNLARLPVLFPDTYRIDGVWFDFELYNATEPIFFSRGWGFEDPTFAQYLAARGITIGPVDGSTPPTGSSLAERAEREPWLDANGLLTDYYDFLEQTLADLASGLKEAVHAVNPRFLVGAYPSPLFSYGGDIYAGWSGPDEPAVVWGTEMYNGGGAAVLPQDLAAGLLPEGYYDLSGPYGKSIYAYYIGGLIAYEYPPPNWGYHLYDVAAGSSGYWIWTTWSFTESLANLPVGYRVPCYDSSDSSLRDCLNAEQYAQTIELYYDQMDTAAAELEKLAADPSHESMLTLTPISAKYLGVETVALPSTCLFASTPRSADELSLAGNLLDLRGQHNLAIQAALDETVSIDIKSILIGMGDPKYGVTYAVAAPGGETVLSGSLAPGADKTVTFTASQAGNHLLMVNPGSGAFAVRRVTAPVSLYAPTELHLISTEGFVTFWVRSDLAHFSVALRGGGGNEGLIATVLKPGAGGWETVATRGTTSDAINSFTLDVDVSGADRGKYWMLRISKPASPMFLEDVYVRFSDVAPYFGLSDDSSYSLRPCGP